MATKYWIFFIGSQIGFECSGGIWIVIINNDQRRHQCCLREREREREREYLVAL